MRTGYRIYENRGFFRVYYNDKKIGRLYPAVADAEGFIAEHEKARLFNIDQMKKETK